MNDDSRDDPVRRRSYHSAVRAAKKEETRQHILDTLVTKMAQGSFSSVSMEEIATAAGLGIATLYRHFPSREVLLDGLSEDFNRRVGEMSLPDTPQELIEVVRRSFVGFDQYPGLVSAFFFSELGRNARTRGRARRLEAIRDALEEVMSNIEEPQRTQALAAIAYLASLQSWVTMTTEFGLTGEQAGQAASWAIQTLLDDLQQRSESNPPDNL